MNGFVSVNWFGILVVVAVVALLTQGFRRSTSGGRIGPRLKAVLVATILLVLGIMAWNIAAMFGAIK